RQPTRYKRRGGYGGFVGCLSICGNGPVGFGHSIHNVPQSEVVGFFHGSLEVRFIVVLDTAKRLTSLGVYRVWGAADSSNCREIQNSADVENRAYLWIRWHVSTVTTL